MQPPSQITVISLCSAVYFNVCVCVCANYVPLALAHLVLMLLREQYTITADENYEEIYGNVLTHQMGYGLWNIEKPILISKQTENNFVFFSTPYIQLLRNMFMITSRPLNGQ